jgi:hypothetical protein
VQLIGDTSAILANFDECGFDSTLYDIQMFCSENDCSGSTIITNMMGHSFQIIGYVNTIMGSMKQFGYVDNTQMFSLSENVGDAIGQIIKVMLNFQSI